ncbi:MAG: hypothetical protein KME52_11915 [Desmonostoc geniculatum HA4340-LM1]|nr:hypothetical protein [Desmonostoc geniculatum HA4340-LM1]
MTFFTINAQATAQTELAPDFEIDSVEDEDFGTLYRLWKSYHFLGSFYQNLDGKWTAQPSNTDCKQECDTEYQAQLVILAMLGLVVPTAA